MDAPISPLAEQIALRVNDGDTIGVGTGSTVDSALRAIGARVAKEGLRIAVVPTSRQSARRCRDFGLTVLDSATIVELGWGFDGADEVDPDLNLIKGKGAALLQEKILAVRCRSFTIIVDESKLVSVLGKKTPVPVETIPSAVGYVERKLQELGAATVTLRSGTGLYGPVVTEAGNVLLDASFPAVNAPLADAIKRITGVVESGLFYNLADEVLVGSPTTVRMLRRG